VAVCGTLVPYHNKNMSELIWPDNTTYFLTGSTFLHYPYFNEPNKKVIVLRQINKVKKFFNLQRVIYSIAINHYHLKFYLEKGTNLKLIKKYIHGGTAFEYKKKCALKYTEMWQPPKTLRIISEEMDWKVTGYIIGNLLKHKEISKIEQLEGNIFCSYDDFIKQFDKETARDLIYSVINVSESPDNIANLSEMNNLKLETD
jgi:hypothetical protein